jgi:hypothetical protein
VKLAVVSYHLPEPEGTAAGRILLATCEGLLAEGHDVTVRSWRIEPPGEDLPSWCSWRELPLASMLRRRLRSLWRPRWESSALEWEPPPGALVVADDPISYPAVAGCRGAVVTFPNLTRLDALATGSRAPADFQQARMERRAARQAPAAIAYSLRVSAALGKTRRAPVPFLPMALRMPAQRFPLAGAGDP